MLKKILILAFFIFGFINGLLAMQSDLHESMIVFARASGIKEYEESAPIPAEHDKDAQERDLAAVQKFFDQCDHKFGLHAAAAKMHLFLQFAPPARTRYEDFFLTNIDVPAFLDQCPNFSFMGTECLMAWYEDVGTDNGEKISKLKMQQACEVLKQLPQKKGIELWLWVRSDEFMNVVQELVNGNNIPCLAYLMNFLKNKDIKPAVPGKNCYELFHHVLRCRCVTASRFFLEYLKVDPNYNYVQIDESVEYRTSPLLVAVARGYLPLVRLLLEYGALPAAAVQVQHKWHSSTFMSAIELAESLRPENQSREIIQLLHESKWR